MNNGCCLNCQAKAKKKKKLKEESDEEDVKQKQKVPQKDKKKNILTWRHTSTKKEKGHGNSLLSEKHGVNPPCYTPRSMMYHDGLNPSNHWPISAAPRGCFPAFSKAPMYGPYGGGGGPYQPYQSMTQATMYNGVHISPYPSMATAAPPPPYWLTRPFMDTNPMTHYTSYADNYSYCFL